MTTKLFIKAKGLFVLLLLLLSSSTLFGAFTPLALPKTWADNADVSNYSAENGCTQSGLGNYSSTQLKFDGSGDYLLIQLADAPDKLEYKLKTNGSSSNTYLFEVLESSTGANNSWSAVKTYNSAPSGTATESNIQLASTTRYIKFLYTTKASGINMALYGVSITKGTSCTSSITITKGDNPANGTFTLTTSGSVCIDEGNASTTVNATPSSHYHLATVTSSGGGNIGSISNNSCTVSNISANTTINVTFAADPTYTVTWVAGTNPSFSTQTNYAGTALTDPGTPDGSIVCGSKVFRGWTATPIVGEDDEAPNDLFTSVSGKSIPEGGTTYYAVFATSSGGGDPDTDTEHGTSTSPYVANDGWTANAGGVYTSSGNYSVNPSIKFNSNNHYVQSPTYDDAITNINFWHKNQGGAGSLKIYVSTDGSSFSELTSERITLTAQQYTVGTKDIDLDEEDGYKAVKIVFSRTSGQCCIDEIAITHGSGTTYSDYATSCGSCSVNPTIGAASLNGSFSLTEVGVSCASSGAGTNCAITEYGWVWSDGATNTDPLINGSGVTNSPKTSGSPAGVGGAFTGTLSGSFTAGHTYYYKAYVTNGKPATTYSSVQTFTPYTVNYNKNEGSAGGSAPSQQVVNTGGTVTLAPATGNFTWTGHYISKWAIGSAGGTQYTPGETSPTISANTTFYAVWATNTYTVTFDKNGGGEGTGTADQNFTYGTAQDLNSCGFTAPDGKYFLGWNTDKNATTATYTNGQEVNNLSNENGATVTLYAIWKDHTYTNYRTLCGCPTYSFHYGIDGEPSNTWSMECFVHAGGESSEYYVNNFTVPEAATATHFYVGYQGSFYNDGLGYSSQSRSKTRRWHGTNADVNSNDHGEMYFAASVGSSANPTVGQAAGATGKLRINDDSNWNNLRCTFMPDGYVFRWGTVGSYQPTSLYTVDAGNANRWYSSVVELNATAADYYISTGLKNSSNNYVASDNTFDARHVFLVPSENWKGNSAKFAIYYWQGVENGWSDFMTPVPGKSGWYEGWIPNGFSNFQFVRLNSDATVPSADKRWNNSADLTFQSGKNCYTITGSGNSPAASWSLYSAHGKYELKLEEGTKNFGVHFYPHFVLHYDANGGSGAPADQSIAADASPCQLTISTTEPTQAGYTFLGWNPTKASADAGTKDDDWDGDDTHAMTGDVTLYAVWAANHTLSYNYNGGDGSSCVGGTYYTGQSFTACSSAGDKTGYTFTGWLGSNSTNYTAGTTYAMPNSDLTLTAQWSATDYVVTMAQSPAAGATLNGGTTTAHYGGTINISTNVPSGYVFNGWTSSPSVTFADASATSTSFTMPASNVTITANFTPTHTATFVGPDGSTLQTVTVAEGAAVAYSESTPVSCDEEANPSSTFVGWATDTWTGKKAAKGNIPVGTTFYDIVGGGESLPNMGNGDVTYYAVFAKATGDPLEENTWTYTFEGQTFKSNGDKVITSAEGDNATWNMEAMDATYLSPISTWGSADGTKGAKFGKSDATDHVSYMYITSTSFTGTVTNVKVQTSGASGIDATFSVSVNSVAYRYSGNTSATLTSSNTEYNFVGNQTISGNTIQLYWFQDESSVALYLRKIEIDYTTGGDISYSNYMTTCSTCTTPSGVTASNITEASADITWSGVSSSGTTGFTIQWGTDGTRTNNDNTANTDANTKTKSLTGLEAGTTYYVWVGSRCDGTWSDRASFTTLAVHDITFNKDNGTLSVVSPVGVVDGETLTFPNVTSTSCGTFVGWKVTEVSDYDNVSAPSPLYKYNDTKENITADESYQAVYRTATGAETNVTDNITIGVTGVTGNYADFTGATASSSAVYTGNVKKDDTRIQMRNSSNSGIVTTTSGGLAKKVTFNWAGSNTSGRIVDVYGKNTAYSSAADLYSADAAVQGTKIGSITYGTSTELTISTDYNYIGIRAKDGAAYASSIDIIWYGTPMSYMTAPTCDAIVGITASFSAFTYVYGSGPSAAQSFMVSGINLSEALVVTAPTNYEVCKTADGTYTSSVSFTPAAGKVSTETVYIRLAAGLNVGTYNYDAANGVSVASNSATPQTAALNGSVTKAAGAIAFTDFNAVDHYEAELEKGMSDIDVTLTVSVTGDGSVSYSKSPAVGVSPTIPATQPTTTLHVLQPGIWTVTATLTAGTNYTGANTNCEVRVKRVDTYVDFIHNKTIKEYSSGATVVDGKMSDWGSGYTVPKIDDNAEETSGSCQQTHFKFIGWVSEDDINIVDGTFKPGYTIVTAGTEEKRSTSKTYYAIWAKLEE